MSSVIGRPAADEYSNGFARYVERVSDSADIVPLLARQRDQLTAPLAGLSDRAAEYRYAPGKWTIKELLGHVCDAERIFAYRLLCIGRGDATPLPGFEEDDYARAAGANARAIADLVDEWHSVRTATMTLVGGMPADAWPRRGTANGRTLSTRALLYVIVGHADHHLHVLRTRYGVTA